MKSFLERNQKLIGAIGASLVLIGTMLALALTGGVFAQTYSVTADFADAAGLRSGDDVLVAGLDAGTVGAVEIKGGYVQVELKINDDVKMPADTDAEIVVETLMGKKSVSLVGGSTEKNLAEGDHIPIESTRTPVELLDLANTSEPLLERSDPDALEDFLVAVTNITEGKRTQVTTLIEGLGDVTESVDSRRKELAGLIDSLETLGATFAGRDDELISLIDNLGVVLGNLSQRTTEVEALLEATDSASHETASLVSRNRGTLDAALRSLHTSLNTVDKHQVDLAALIAYLNDAVEGYASVGYSQGVPNRWFNIFVQSLGPVGVDAALGPCGAFDQALDSLLGPDPRPCPDRAEYGRQEGPDSETGGGSSSNSDKQGSRAGGGSNEGGTDDGAEALPGDIGDLIGGVTGDTTLVEELRGVLP